MKFQKLWLLPSNISMCYGKIKRVIQIIFPNISILAPLPTAGGKKGLGKRDFFRFKVSLIMLCFFQSCIQRKSNHSNFLCISYLYKRKADTYLPKVSFKTPPFPPIINRLFENVSSFLSLPQLFSATWCHSQWFKSRALQDRQIESNTKSATQKYHFV